MPRAAFLSYNLHHHLAYPELTGLIKTHSVDVLCLQECFTDELASSLAGLRLAAKTSTGKLGLAVYYNEARYSIKKSISIPIRLSAYERMRAEVRERLLVVELVDRRTKDLLLVASFHATHLVAPNATRRQQIRTALSNLDDMRDGRPVVLMGDFNYPFFHKRLRSMTENLGYSLLIPDGPTYSGRHFLGRFDMAAVVDLSLQIQVLPFKGSDHAPVLLC